MSDERTNRTAKKRSRRAITKTGEWKPRFLEKLAEMGIVGVALTFANVSRNTAYMHRRNDPAFAKSWRQSLKQAGDAMEAEAWRRGIKGVTRPVFQGGKKVGAMQEYSDTLLIFLLKGCRPNKFRDNVKHEHSGPRDGPIQYEDLSSLDTDELRKLREIQVKLTSAQSHRN